MLRIYDNIPENLIKEYVDTAVSYLKKKKEENNVSFDIDNNLELIKKILGDANFKLINGKDFNITSLEQLFYHTVKKRGVLDNNDQNIAKDNRKLKSIYDGFLDIVLDNKKNKKESLEIDNQVKLKPRRISELLSLIIRKLNIKVCPYCGRNHIDSIEVDIYDETNNKKKRIIAPCLDHFYAKGAKDSNKNNKNDTEKSDKYIHYSLSLYNLIPSCYLCNSQFKHNKDVEDQKYQILYPYKEGFENYIKFSLGSNSEEDILKIVERLTTKTTEDTSDLPDLSIKLVKNEQSLNAHFKDKSDLDSFLNKCVNSNKMFHIEEIYNQQHIQNAVDLINKIVWFRKNYIKSFLEIIGYLGNENNLNEIKESIFSKIPDLYLSHLKSILENNELKDNEIREILKHDFKYLFGRWLDPENDLKEPLSKFYRDIYKQITEPHLYELLDENIK